LRGAARHKWGSFHPASDADIVATTDIVVTVVNTVADIAIYATGNIAYVTTAFGAVAATTTTTAAAAAANLCDEFDG